MDLGANIRLAVCQGTEMKNGIVTLIVVSSLSLLAFASQAKVTLHFDPAPVALDSTTTKDEQGECSLLASSMPSPFGSIAISSDDPIPPCNDFGGSSSVFQYRNFLLPDGSTVKQRREVQTYFWTDGVTYLCLPWQTTTDPNGLTNTNCPDDTCHTF